MHLQFKILLQEHSVFIREKEGEKKEEIIFGDSFLELFVIFQVLIFVSPLFCNHLADQKYP